MYMGICVSLANYQTVLHPLRNEDGEKYRGWLKGILTRSSGETRDKIYSKGMQ